MDNWNNVTLGDVCDLIPGFAFKSADFGDYYSKVVKIGDIQPPYIDNNSVKGVDLTNYQIEKLSKYQIKYDDFVLAMTGATIGKIGRYISDELAYINQRVLLFRPKSEYIAKFIYYITQTDTFQKYILNHIDSETAQPNISAKSIGGYPVRIPSVELQKKIANILSSIDSKIELNRKINDNFKISA